MKLSFLKNPIVRFLIAVFSLYLLWILLYKFWIHPSERADLFVDDVITSSTKWILELLGYTVFSGSDRVIGIDGTGGFWIGDDCNGIYEIVVFSIFIIAYSGKWRYKIPYILIGIVIIEILNIFRVVCLAIIDTYSHAWQQFNHTYTFKIIIYAVVFGLWIFWVNRFSKKGIA